MLFSGDVDCDGLVCNLFGNNIYCIDWVDLVQYGYLVKVKVVWYDV